MEVCLEAISMKRDTAQKETPTKSPWVGPRSGRFWGDEEELQCGLQAGADDPDMKRLLDKADQVLAETVLTKKPGQEDDR